MAFEAPGLGPVMELGGVRYRPRHKGAETANHCRPRAIDRHDKLLAWLQAYVFDLSNVPRRTLNQSNTRSCTNA